jgi:protein gp37
VADRSAIEWTDATWNPVTGCIEVSPGCDHCYARRFAERFRGVPGHPYEQGFDVKLWPERLDVPRRWRRPRRVFVNSMSDLFQDAVPEAFVLDVFAVMAASSQHVFQVLTKRPGRMASVVNSLDPEMVWRQAEARFEARRNDDPWPLPNVWLGISVEDQRWARIRIPKLIETTASIRFLSCEPLLGPVDLMDVPSAGSGSPPEYSWVIVGGESGPGARSIDPGWVRHLRDQSRDLGVAFFFKQWGGRTSKSGGRELEGRTWDEMPTASATNFRSPVAAG